MRCLDTCFSNSFCCVLVLDTTKSSPCLKHGYVNCARNGADKAKFCPCRSYPTRNIEALCSTFRSIRGFVQNFIPICALVVFTWHFDHNRATCRAVKMRPVDVVESQNFLCSRCSPLAGHTSTEHDLEAVQPARSRKRAVRVLWCQFAHSLGLRNQPGSDEWIRGITLVRVDPSCADGFQPRLVQVTHRNFMVTCN